MPLPPSLRSRREVPIVLATTALLSFAPISRGAALALVELGIAAFFINSITFPTVGSLAPWFVLGAVLIGVACRAVDIESWSLFIPRGLVGRAREAFGPTAAAIAAAVVLTERLFLTALACLVAGHYLASFLFAVIAGLELNVRGTPEEVSTVVAVVLLGALWIRDRLGYPAPVSRLPRLVWLSVAGFGVLVLWAIGTTLVHGTWRALLPHAPLPALLTESATWPRRLLSIATVAGAGLVALGQALPAIGGGEALARVSGELPPPRVNGLRRIAAIGGAFALLIVVPLSFLFGAIVPATAWQTPWHASIITIASHLGGPGPLRFIFTALLVAGSLVMLTYAADAGLSDARSALVRVAEDRALPEGLRVAHARFGTFAGAVDSVAAIVIFTLVASSGRVGWIARAYAISVVWTVLFKVATLVTLRRRRKESPFRASPTWRVRGREWPIGLWTTALLVAAPGLALLVRGDGGALVGTVMLAGMATLFVLTPARSSPQAEAEELDTSQFVPSTQLSLDQIQPRVGTVLVPVRNPHALAHVVAALQMPPDREVVVMTVRLIGVDAEDDTVSDEHPTPAERALFSRVLAIAERYRRPVRLLVVPGRNVFDAIVGAILRLQASEVHVGESVTLSAEAQARLLGDAWERSEPAEGRDVHLVIHHASGRTDVYHLGAHAPALTSRDLDLIHRLWLDAIKFDPQVHHHDVVRAALIQMAEKLNGPGRDEALRAIAQAAKPADELAEVVRTREYSKLRDIVRNRPPSDLAGLLGELSIEDQVVVFRLLPRKDAAATFEYLSTESREALLKAMAKEQVATLLNDMAPDDRTMFLEELPATVTRELLTLLTPQERSVALTLLGYPEASVGRLMTPHYVAVHEDWTVQQVLDYVRTHGRDSETLNVIYVVDDRGLLIDDIRIREFLLTATTTRVSELMDRRFVALKATDDQKTAVSAFREHDRSALPVTDSAGMLIGIVTVDDVLDVAEATATSEIQRIGGSEALEEPYMRIAFGRMIQKRAGWLTALFLGEMLTATAMGAFEAEIQKAVVLALFVPLIISSGGNSGSQASTLVIRALALGEVTIRDWWKVIRREIAAGLALGVILGAIGFFRITLWSAFFDTYGQYWLLVAITVGIALIGIVLWGTLIGSLLPFLLRRLGFDPATSSAPFVATLVDVTGLVIYFSVALVILHGRLL